MVDVEPLLYGCQQHMGTLEKGGQREKCIRTIAGYYDNAEW